MPRRTGRAVAALGLLLVAARTVAADGGVTALADRTELTRDGLLHVTVRFEGRTMPSRLDPPPGDYGFEIVGRSQSQQTFVSFGSGGVQQQHAVQWDLTLAPRRDGSLSIPPFVISVGAERLRTDAIAVKVLPAGRAPHPPPAARAPATAPSAGWHGWERDLWLELQVDRKNPWLGEQVTASLYLVSPVSEVDVETFRQPASFDGFWTEILEVPGRLQPQPRKVRGVPLYYSLVRRLALFPTRAGRLVIPSYEADVLLQLVSGNRSFFAFRSVERAHRASAPVELDVRPLPAGAPPGFDAVNVGSLSLELSPSERTIPAGEPVALRLTARGEGNVRAWALPSLPPIAGTRRYDPTRSEELKADRGRISGRRTIETLLVPERAGELVIPPIAWPWFDAKAGRYAVARTAELRIPVGAGAGIPAPATRAAAEGLRPIRADGALSRRGEPPWSGPLLPLLLLLPPGAFAALRLSGRIRERTQLEAPARRFRGAVRAARRRLSGAERLLRAGDAEGFVAEVERSLTGYVGDKLGRPIAGLTRGELSSALTGAGAHPPAVGALLAALDGCDAARFGGAAPGAPLLDAAAEAMALLEESDWSSGRGARA